MARSFNRSTITRREAIRLGLVGMCCFSSLGLAACAPEDKLSQQQQNGTPAANDAPTPVAIDAAAFDALIEQGPVADAARVAKSTWATKVAQAGKLRIGGVKTSILFSILDEKDGKVRGFDAGLSQMLTRYIVGDTQKQELTLVTSNTRESVLQNDQVDVVFATYSITDARKKVISFAGPYYTTQQGILVTADNTSINGLADLANKKVAAQSGSTGPSILEELAPEATVQEFATDEEARGALSQGRVDAYVIDETMQRGSIVRNPGKYKLVGESFGPVDSYGIGVPHDSDAVQFINEFLKMIIDSGVWEKLWNITIGVRTQATKAPQPPALGV